MQEIGIGTIYRTYNYSLVTLSKYCLEYKQLALTTDKRAEVCIKFWLLSSGLF